MRSRIKSVLRLLQHQLIVNLLSPRAHRTSIWNAPYKNFPQQATIRVEKNRLKK